MVDKTSSVINKRPTFPPFALKSDCIMVLELLLIAGHRNLKPIKQQPTCDLMCLSKTLSAIRLHFHEQYQTHMLPHSISEQGTEIRTHDTISQLEALHPAHPH